MDITVEEMKKRLSEAALARDIIYSMVKFIGLVFEDDDSGAQDDLIAISQALTQAVQIPSADVHKVILPSSLSGGITTEEYIEDNVIRHLIRPMISIPGKKLILLYYAGHGMKSTEGLTCAAKDVRFCQKFDWGVFDKELLRPAQDYMREKVKDIDVAVILDCCYASTPYRSHGSIQRSVEISGASDGISAARLTPPSFTPQVINILETHLKKGIRPITLQNIFRDLHHGQSARPGPSGLPVYKLLSGQQPISIPVDGTQINQEPKNSLLRPDLAQSIHAPPPPPPPTKITTALEITHEGKPNSETTAILARHIFALERQFNVNVLSVQEGAS